MKRSEESRRKQAETLRRKYANGETWCTPSTIHQMIWEKLGCGCDVIYLRRVLKQLGWQRSVGFGWLPKGGISRFAVIGHEAAE